MVTQTLFTEETNSHEITIGEKSLCEKCHERPQEHIHHTIFDPITNKSDKKSPTIKICTLCHSKIHGTEPQIGELKRLVLLHRKTQQTRCSINNQIRAYGRIEFIVPDFMNALSKELLKKEKAYEKQIKLLLEKQTFLSSENHRDVENHSSNVYPTYSFLTSIKGISHLLAGKIIAYVDTKKAPNVSSLWKYAGQAPDSKKVKGKTANWNQELKMICFQIADSFVKQRTPKYRDIYDKEKAKQLKLLETTSCEITNNHQSQDSNSDADRSCKDNHLYYVGSVPKSKMHAHRRAMRKAIKEFLKDYWIEAKKQEAQA